MATAPLLEVVDLRLDIAVSGGTLHALRGVDLSLAAGRTLALVGESGSGKSLTALSILGLQPAHAQRRAQALRLGDTDLLALDEEALARRVRGTQAAMIFQEPMTSLNPVLTVGEQLTESLTAHGLASAEEARQRAVMLLERVGIASASARLRQYPHQFSGGQRQRVMIAMALMAKPKLLIADEPTTALDVTVQAEILKLLHELRDEFGMALLLVSHNLGIVSRVADDVAVMYAGQVVEQASATELFAQPRHPYTRGLLAAIPGTGSRRMRRLEAIAGVVPSLVGATRGCAFAPRCALVQPVCRTDAPPSRVLGENRRVRCILPADLRVSAPVDAAALDAALPTVTADAGAGADILLGATGLVRHYSVRQGLWAPARSLRAVDGVDLAVRRGEVLALVGESGCGKSTLARLLLGLEVADAGSIERGDRVADGVADRVAGGATGGRELARFVQPVFQDPMGSLNPRRTVAEIVRRPLEVHAIGDRASRDARVLALLDQVGLPRRLFHAYPAQLSGGQRQRVAIARALVLEPQLLLCDEPTSALDVSVQAQILNLLAELREQRGLTLLVITHDLSVVRHMAQRVAVMYLGRIVEEGLTEQVFAHPAHPYTRALVAAALPIDTHGGIPPSELKPGFPNPLDIVAGCRFAPRCPLARDLCTSEPPRRASRDGYAMCHFAAAAA